ncbi:hypothetical protein K6U06_09110 [Acidiferrimicrobium sp. IK]|uniref:hypothetical protein n=1 Tax=Acidiferrimicrobium sp. IK TaxID=2871700 RepID=UPI0021CB64FA|nr:hypothetical protein [Acidiferrimicrobium sp. IK]MCU4184519.1 hypothetical protein [Acidiferrimicrobium sp. IK]
MSKRRRPSASKRVAEAKFWGPDEPPAPAQTVIDPTPDPAAMIRSLGAPPLAVDASVAERHLTAVYEEAVRAATALAAANGLLTGPE